MENTQVIKKIYDTMLQYPIRSELKHLLIDNKQILLQIPANVNPEYNFTFQGSLLVHTFIMCEIVLELNKTIPDFIKKYTIGQLLQTCIIHDLGKIKMYSRGDDGKFKVIKYKKVIQLTFQLMNEYNLLQNINPIIIQALDLINGIFDFKTINTIINNFKNIHCLTHIIQTGETLSSVIGIQYNKLNKNINDILHIDDNNEIHLKSLGK